jgi:hypothetical protein
MMQRLSGWQRLGLIISVCWIVGSFFGLRFYQYNEGMNIARAAVGVCTTGGGSFDRCYDSSAALRLIARTIYWPPLLLVSLGPIPLLWLVGWAVIRAGRWLRAGFAT